MTFILAVLKNESEVDHQGWVRACDDYQKEIEYDVIDLTKVDWLERVSRSHYDCFLTRPPGESSLFKQLYDERIYILHHVLKKMIYPRYEEILIHENKRMLAYWLQAHAIAHPRTWIFYHKQDARDFLETCSLPIVAKTAIGAAGSGIVIHRTRKSLEKYIDRAFSRRGIGRKWGPNLRKGELRRRLAKRLINMPATVRYFRKKYDIRRLEPQRSFVIFQEYIPCDYEWRCVRIGDSYFGHKKLRRRGELFSGTSEVSWDGPSVKLLEFVKNVCDHGDFLSQAIDIFEDSTGRFLVNEMQCFFGSKNPHQMIIDGRPGRYVLKNSEWIFEEGNFNMNNSFDLRLKHVLRILERAQT